MQRFWREPLVHFVILASLIFVGYELLARHRSSAQSTIFVSAADMERMAALYAGEARTLPGTDDLRAMVADHVRQQALIREAKRLGLDRDDIVIDRRLAQKMNFMLTDLSAPPEPTEQQLSDWHQLHAEKFTQAERRSFQHVFFTDPDDARIAEAANLLRQESDLDWRSRGDPFILQREYANLPRREVARLFGVQFADALFSAQVARGQWNEPWRSSYGMHIVKVSAIIPQRLPTLSSIREQVVSDWRDVQTRRTNAQAVTDIIERYEVQIEGAGN